MKEKIRKLACEHGGFLQEVKSFKTSIQRQITEHFPPGWANRGMASSRFRIPALSASLDNVQLHLLAPADTMQRERFRELILKRKMGEFAGRLLTRPIQWGSVDRLLLGCRWQR
jgi:hypothetical protein